LSRMPASQAQRDRSPPRRRRAVGPDRARLWIKLVEFAPASKELSETCFLRQDYEGGGTRKCGCRASAVKRNTQRRLFGPPIADRRHRRVRGLAVDAWIVADEAARLSNDLIAALRPMRARRPHARHVMLSIAWRVTGPFWTAWSSNDPRGLGLRPRPM
jgi:hypothetical protein